MYLGYRSKNSDLEDNLNKDQICSLKISSSLVNIKLHNKNQPPCFLHSGNSYEEDLKIRIWNMTFTILRIMLHIKSKLHAENQLLMCSASRIFLVILIVRVIVVTGGKQSQPSLSLDGFGLDLDRSCLEVENRRK